MKECSKSIQRRLSDSRFIRNYFLGDGVDIGGKPDPLALYSEIFPGIKSLKTWDLEDGDAQFMEGVHDSYFDFVHSSHCLEHLNDPKEGLKNWFRVVKPGGHLIFTVPDEDLYEQGIFPSTYNRDHKWTFTIYKQESWSHKSINIIDLVRELGEEVDVIKIEQLTASYRFNIPRYDQTLTPIAECGIEIVLRKRSKDEVLAKGRWERNAVQPTKEMRTCFNQYIDDMASMKKSNEGSVPFTNDKDL